MNCSKCGNVLGQGDIMCSQCGMPVQMVPVAPGVAPIENTTPVNVAPVPVQNNDVNTPTENGNPKMRNKNMLIGGVIAAIGIIIIIVGVVIGLTATPVETDEEEGLSEEDLALPRFEYDDFGFPYLEDYVKQITDDGYLLLEDDDDQLMIVISIYEEATIDMVGNQIKGIKDTITNLGHTIVSEERNDFSKVNWIYMNAKSTIKNNNVTSILGFAGLGKYHVLLAQVFNFSSNESNSMKAIENLSKSISKALYQGSTTYDPIDPSSTKNFKIPVFDYNIPSEFLNNN